MSQPSRPVALFTLRHLRPHRRVFRILLSALAVVVASSCQQAESTHVAVDADAACLTCHRDDFGEAQQPLHVDNISTQCEQCHANEAWAPARGSAHSFALRGAHESVSCNGCHDGTTPVYDGTPDSCIDCHQQDRASATSPDHKELSEACGGCHSDSAWSPATLEHEWPLEGAHQQASCGQCHTGDPPVYEGTPDACIDCHSADRERAVEPPHVAFSEQCGDCHSAQDWTPAAFEHSWPLTGSHLQAACSSCHDGDPPVYEGTLDACIDCHSADRERAVEPPHAAFSDACGDCHSTVSWLAADFQHTSSFPLSGGHSRPVCGDCHTGSPAVFAGQSAACVSCHEADFAVATFPGHDAFPPTCDDCHSTDAWSPATAAHPESRFPTRGDHNMACNDCHNPALGPNGSGNADCVGCHQGEHTLARMDAEHRGQRNYPTGPDRAPNFCLACHPDGRE